VFANQFCAEEAAAYTSG